MILTFSILSWVACFIFGIVAWSMASADLKEMQAGRMDPSGESLTNAGRIVAMIHLIMSAAILGLYVLFILFFVVFGLVAA